VATIIKRSAEKGCYSLSAAGVSASSYKSQSGSVKSTDIPLACGGSGFSDSGGS
jgi:hypothetical protein